MNLFKIKENDIVYQYKCSKTIARTPLDYYYSDFYSWIHYNFLKWYFKRRDVKESIKQTSLKQHAVWHSMNIASNSLCEIMFNKLGEKYETTDDNSKVNHLQQKHKF